jgi:hypothetical protein
MLFSFILLIGCENLNSEREFENSSSIREGYNKEVDREILKTYFPKQQNYKFSTNGSSTYIKGDCPSIKFQEKSITIDYSISDITVAKNIAVLNIYMEKKELLNEKIVWKAVMDKYFMPDFINNIQIKNNLPKGDYKLWYGFYLKEDSLNSFPKLYKKVCHITVE